MSLINLIAIVLTLQTHQYFLASGQEYSHAINDCPHLCYYVRSCIRECERGFAHRGGPGYGSHRRSHRGSNRRHYDEPDHDESDELDESDEPRRIRSYSSMGSSSSKPKKKLGRSMSGYGNVQSPHHCGLRYAEGRGPRSDLLGGQGMGRIVGGEDAEPNEFPWLVSLQMLRDGKSKHFCGGSIINQHFILTAAHCTDSLAGKENKVVVKAGVNMWNEKGQVVGVERFIVHSGWDKTVQMNDISLVQLQRPLKYKVASNGQYHINAICLPTDGEDPLGYAELAGWGQLGEDKASPEWLQKITMPIWERRKCGVHYREYMPITPKHVCSGGMSGGEDSCMGDSGGPLMQTRGDRTVQIGLVSFGIPCAVKGLPGVYTNLIYFMNWMSSQMS